MNKIWWIPIIIIALIIASFMYWVNGEGFNESDIEYTIDLTNQSEQMFVFAPSLPNCVNEEVITWEEEFDNFTILCIGGDSRNGTCDSELWTVCFPHEYYKELKDILEKIE